MPEGFLEWIRMPNAWEKSPEALPLYGQYNVEAGTGHDYRLEKWNKNHAVYLPGKETIRFLDTTDEEIWVIYDDYYGRVAGGELCDRQEGVVRASEASAWTPYGER